MTVVAYVLLTIGVAVTLMSCLGVLVMPNVFDRLHYTSPATTLGAFAVALAVVVAQGWAAASAKAMLVFALLLVSGSVVTHATARAARIRQFGHWVALRAERVEEPEGPP